MCPEPGEIRARNHQEIKLKPRPEKQGTRISEHEMKNKAGNEQNGNQYEKFVQHAQLPPPQAGGDDFHRFGKLTHRTFLLFFGRCPCSDRA
jgi:hypothetical protein